MLLADDRAHGPAEQEGAQLVQHRPGRLRAHRFAEAVVPLPERLQPDRVVQLVEQLLAPVRVGEQPRHVGERRARSGLEQRQEAGAEDVVGARSPEALVDAAEDPDQLIDDEVVVGALEHVQAGRLRVERIEHIDPLLAAVGDAGEDLLDQVALRIDHDRAAASVEIVEHEPRDQRRLADPGRAEQVQVVARVGDREHNRARRARSHRAASRLPANRVAG